MKKLFSIISVLFLVQVHAQQQVKCPSELEAFKKMVSETKYNEAIPTMKLLLQKCPSVDESLYPAAISVLQYKVEMAANDDKIDFGKELVKVYEAYDAYFPANKNGNGVNKAMLMYDLQLVDDAEVLKTFQQAFEKDKYQFTNPTALYTFFRFYLERYKASENPDFDALMDTYTGVLAVVNKYGAPGAENELAFANVKLAADSVLKNYVTANYLATYAERNLIKNKTNTEWLEPMVSLMLPLCPEKTAFGNVALNLYNEKPSTLSAYALGLYNIRNNNTEKGVEYLEKAAQLAPNPTAKAKVYYDNALLFFTFDKKKAKSSAYAAIENDKANGDYYIFLANLYASGVYDCAPSEKEKKAVLYLATRFAQKGTEVQPSLKPTSDALAAEFGKNGFSDKEIDKLKKEKVSITIECWINETIEF